MQSTEYNLKCIFVVPTGLPTEVRFGLVGSFGLILLIRINNIGIIMLRVYIPTR